MHLIEHTRSHIHCIVNLNLYAVVCDVAIAACRNYHKSPTYFCVPGGACEKSLGDYFKRSVIKWNIL